MKIVRVIGYCIFIFIFFLSCSKKREVNVLGYAYKGERITVTHEQDTVFNFKVENKGDSISICSFYEIAQFNTSKEKIILRVVVDSNSINVLDTIISFSKEKEPFISLLYPHDLKDNKRKLFVGNHADFLKY
jgi:hypothetical protein